MSVKVKTAIMYIFSAICGFSALNIFQGLIANMMGGEEAARIASGAIAGVLGVVVFYIICLIFAKMFKISGPKL